VSLQELTIRISKKIISSLSGNMISYYIFSYVLFNKLMFLFNFICILQNILSVLNKNITPEEYEEMEHKDVKHFKD
jgi:hypothetical protein